MGVVQSMLREPAHRSPRSSREVDFSEWPERMRVTATPGASFGNHYLLGLILPDYIGATQNALSSYSPRDIDDLRNVREERASALEPEGITLYYTDFTEGALAVVRSGKVVAHCAGRSENGSYIIDALQPATLNEVLLEAMADPWSIPLVAYSWEATVNGKTLSYRRGLCDSIAAAETDSALLRALRRR